MTNLSSWEAEAAELRVWDHPGLKCWGDEVSGTEQDNALPKISKAGFAALQLEYFLTAGPDGVHAWTISKAVTAPQAAGKIHTDFGKGFIMAEVMKDEDLKEESSENAAKAAGKYKQQGRAYVVEDGDIIFFKFNSPQQLKKK